jgi:phenylpyruvate tautomerase PptA (4-oxalocrotonate tautomerase family)
MPHIVIKTISGPSKTQLKLADEQIAAVVNKTLGKPEKYISVSVEEYSFAVRFAENRSRILRFVFS